MPTNINCALNLTERGEKRKIEAAIEHLYIKREWENTNSKLNSITAATINIISVAFKIISGRIMEKKSHTSTCI